MLKSWIKKYIYTSSVYILEPSRNDITYDEVDERLVQVLKQHLEIDCLIQRLLPVYLENWKETIRV